MSLRTLVGRWVRGRGTSKVEAGSEGTRASDGQGAAFGYKGSWLAIRGAAPERVIAALGIEKAKEVGWAKGIEGAYEGKVFVSPPVDGWVLVVSTRLPGMGDANHGDEVTPLLVRVSRALEATVQYFQTHRVVEAHSWAWAERGEILRAYGYVGDQGLTVMEVGTRTEGEVALGVRLFDERSPEAEEDAYWERADLRYPDEELVMEIAGAWSVDPRTLDEREVDAVGWLGQWPRG